MQDKLPLTTVDPAGLQCPCLRRNGRQQVMSTIGRAYPVLHSDAEIAWKAASLDWPKRRGSSQHLDPADRAIMAACILHNLTIVTADKEIHHYAGMIGVKVLW